MENSVITRIKPLEILDSRANPTVSLKMYDSYNHMVQVSVPSGASTGIHEALELRDNDKARFNGKGVLLAVKNIADIISPLVIGRDVFDYEEIEKDILILDGTSNKGKLGANAILAVSLALRRLNAINRNAELFQTFMGEKKIPVPMLNVLNGGAHASNNLDIQEFMIMPLGFDTFKEALRASTEVYHVLKRILHAERKNTGIGDEGGFAPALESDEEGLKLLVHAIDEAGYTGKFKLALDVAASEFKTDKKGFYHLKKRNKFVTSKELISYYQYLCNNYPLCSIEDGLDEDDIEGWIDLTKTLKNVQLVGDDLFVTNKKRLIDGVDSKYGNAILIKYNQIGSIYETLETIKYAQDSKYQTIISHRSGETDESFIADLAVGTGSTQIKTGAPARYERVAKYNRLLEIEEEYGIPYIGKTLNNIL